MIELINQIFFFSVSLHRPYRIPKTMGFNFPWIIKFLNIPSIIERSLCQWDPLLKPFRFESRLEKGILFITIQYPNGIISYSTLRENWCQGKHKKLLSPFRSHYFNFNRKCVSICSGQLFFFYFGSTIKS